MNKEMVLCLCSVLYYGLFDLWNSFRLFSRHMYVDYDEGWNECLCWRENIDRMKIVYLSDLDEAETLFSLLSKPK
ncbi:hypothetical protein J0A71_07g14640 [Encephalitozoon cuniculi]|nr:hypothetical protein J0A71_07g14640 [Encephalitozoon cuniculi]